MGHGKDYTMAEIAEIKSFLKDGLTYDEVAELTGRSKKAITNLASRQGWTNGRYKSDATDASSWDTILKTQETELPFAENTKTLDEIKQETPTPVKEKTLADFRPRDIIKHLYNLGYRIKGSDWRLVCTVEQTVNLKDIING